MVEVSSSARIWSTEQQAIFQWFATGTGTLVVRARAGTGKTTTILEGIGHAPIGQLILLCAFNKRIASELATRLTHPNAEALTLHSVGFRIVRRFWERLSIDERGERAWSLAADATRGAPDPIIRLIAKLHSLAREMMPLATDPVSLRDLAWAHDCVPDEEWEDFGWTLDLVCAAALEAMRLARNRPVRTGIDFPDMLYLPVVNDWIRPRYDLVVVDEAQDMNVAQLELARRLTRGRVCVVGDDRQAIYGFRGADCQSLDRLKSELGATELGLTTTYRCGRCIVAQAQQFVPDYYAAPQNPEGVVTTISEARLLESLAVGDVVLSRANAPIIGLCLKALRLGLPARVEGRDVAATLRTLIKKLAKGRAAESVPEFLKRLATWEQREYHRIEKSRLRYPERQVELVRDKADALRTMADGISGIAELQARLEEVFTELAAGRAIVFSSVHKAKGLEWARVFLLADTFRETDQEERNIQYVAITRAIQQLTWVSRDGRGGG